MRKKLLSCARLELENFAVADIYALILQRTKKIYLNYFKMRSALLHAEPEHNVIYVELCCLHSAYAT